MTYIIISKNNFKDSLTQYGDGVFETMLGLESKIYHWEYHWSRLKSSCKRLDINIPDGDKLYSEIQANLAQENHERSVIKMIVSRGEGLRGYRSHPQQPCFIQFQITPCTRSLKSNKGLNIRVCNTRLAKQPLLAGMKHLNRLEYVMARREHEEALFDEGLLLNYDDEIIEGLVSNLFIIKNRKIISPNLTECGVTGTMRAYLLDNLSSWEYPVSICSLSLTDVLSADEVFLTNATNGIMSVGAIKDKNNNMTTFKNTVTNLIIQLVNHPCSKL